MLDKTKLNSNYWNWPLWIEWIAKDCSFSQSLPNCFKFHMGRHFSSTRWPEEIKTLYSIITSSTIPLHITEESTNIARRYASFWGLVQMDNVWDIRVANCTFLFSTSLHDQCFDSCQSYGFRIWSTWRFHPSMTAHLCMVGPSSCHMPSYTWE